jgi:hypothetical protein
MDLTGLLCSFVDTNCGSRALTKEKFREALQGIKWKGDFEEFWTELVYQIKEDCGQNIHHSVAQSVSEIQTDELASFYGSDKYSFAKKIQTACASLFGICNAIMSEFDSDGDGYIAGDELEMMATVISSRARTIFSPDDIKHQLDADSNGKISLEKLTSSIFGPYAAAAAKAASRATPFDMPQHTPWSWQIIDQPDEFLVLQAPPGTPLPPYSRTCSGTEDVCLTNSGSGSGAQSVAGSDGTAACDKTNSP